MHRTRWYAFSHKCRIVKSGRVWDPRELLQPSLIVNGSSRADAFVLLGQRLCGRANIPHLVMNVTNEELCFIYHENKISSVPALPEKSVAPPSVETPHRTRASHVLLCTFRCRHATYNRMWHCSDTEFPVGCIQFADFSFRPLAVLQTCNRLSDFLMNFPIQKSCSETGLTLSMNLALLSWGQFLLCYTFSCPHHQCWVVIWITRL